ncbi:MAG: DUF2625 family protein [Deltaproteobacteria bacterium]
MRPLNELLSSEPFLRDFQRWTDEATNEVEVLTPSAAMREACLLHLQVTTRSPLGTIAYETGGVLVQHGWVRLLGSGHERLPRSLLSANARERVRLLPVGCLHIADDVLGGIFVLNGGGVPGEAGHVAYFAPDSLRWEDTSLGFGDFLSWLLHGDLDGFYAAQRWDDWASEVRALQGDQTFSIYPPLWAQGPSIAERSRRPVPSTEALEGQFELQDQLASSTEDG